MLLTLPIAMIAVASASDPCDVDKAAAEPLRDGRLRLHEAWWWTRERAAA